MKKLIVVAVVLSFFVLLWHWTRKGNEVKSNQMREYVFDIWQRGHQEGEIMALRGMHNHFADDDSLYKIDSVAVLRYINAIK